MGYAALMEHNIWRRFVGCQSGRDAVAGLFAGRSGARNAPSRDAETLRYAGLKERR
jgi:hypothetical protein